MLADVDYQSRTQDFWNACAAIAGERHWEIFAGLCRGAGARPPLFQTPILQLW